MRKKLPFNRSYIVSLSELLRSNEDLKKKQELLKTIPGIAEVGSLYLLLATKGFTRFKNWRKFACYCGIAPFEYSSGSSIRGRNRVNLRLCDLDFDRKQLKVVQGKGKKDRYLPLSEHLIRGLKKYIEAEKPQDYLFGMPREGRAGGMFDSRYSQRGVQWAVKQASKTAKILKEVSVHTLRHSFATHLLEDGMDILSIKNLLGHESIDTTLVYLQIAQLSTQKLFSPLDTLFEECRSK